LKLADGSRYERSRYRRKTVDKLDDSRETAAGTLDATASTLHTRGDQISGAAHSAANKIHATANYLRQANVKGMVDGIEVTLRRRL
jgi:hypothetical protein